MGPCEIMTDTLAPVERTNWALSAWNSTLDQNDVPSAWLYGQDHLWAAGFDAHLRKNRLKRPKIKQGTTSKVNCILFNRLLSPVLLNKSGLVRAKAGSFTLKTLNGCFSNYYQVRTWPVFAEKVTYVHGHRCSAYIHVYI